MNDERLSAARRALGDNFVEYVLNAEPSTLDHLEVSDARSECLNLLNEFASVLLMARDNTERITIQTQLVAPSAFLSKSPHAGAASAMRLKCGGDLPSTDSGDETERLLLEFVRDAYPLLLMPIPEIAFALPVIYSSGLAKIPAAQRLESAIMADEHLRKLFPDVSLEEAKRIGSYPVWRSGIGNHNRPKSVIISIIEHVLILAALERDPSQETCARIARKTLSLSREIARRETVSLPVVIGISGIEIAADVHRIDLTFGEIRASTPLTRAAFSQGDRGSPIGAIMVIPVSEQLVDVRSWEPGHGPTEDDLNELWKKRISDADSRSRLVEKLTTAGRYALLLASEGRDFIAARVEVTKQLNPLDTAHQVHQATTPFQPFPIARIERADALRIAEWAQRVDRDHPEFLDVGVRRILSAASLRLDPLDGFIDAVMCWENLFGDKAETALKVCGSLAILLEPSDAEKRRTLFRELKKLYNTRSELVHGKREPNYQIAHEHRDRALQISLQAMRTAFDTPGLLKTPSSLDRFEQVLLGFPPPD